jgi:mannose/fructose/sorbose-specific phosphotransferase system IIA component
MIGIVVITHGPLADGLVTSLKFFSGDTDQLTHVILQDEDSPEDFLKRLKDAVTQVDTNEGIVILSDILGGTPSNQALMFSMNRADVRVVSGVNLMMLIEATLSRAVISDLDDFVSKIIQSGKESILDLTKQYSQSQLDDIDDIDSLI